MREIVTRTDSDVISKPTAGPGASWCAVPSSRAPVAAGVPALTPPCCVSDAPQPVSSALTRRVNITTLILWGKKLRLQVFASPARTCSFKRSSQNTFRVCLPPTTLSYFEKVKERFLRWMRTPWQEKLRGTQKWGPACLLFA